MEVAPKKGQVFVKTVPPSTSRADLEKVGPKEINAVAQANVRIAV
jgi:hypothetical protein